MEVSHSFDAYQAAFYEYAGRFDSSDGRVALKIVHTDAVVAIMKRLCSMRKLPKHTESLALLCALFHDIGRFEQLKQYDTFLDHKSVDHAALSCQVLKENQILAALPAPDQEMILTAIANHNRLEIDENSVSGEEGMTLCRLLRDADKCDIFRVFATDDMTDVIGVPDEIPAGETVSPAVLSAVREHRCVDKRIRETHLDFWVSFLSFFFDLNYPESAAIAKEQGVVQILKQARIFRAQRTVDELLHRPAAVPGNPGLRALPLGGRFPPCLPDDLLRRGLGLPAGICNDLARLPACIFHGHGIIPLHSCRFPPLGLGTRVQAAHLTFPVGEQPAQRPKQEMPDDQKGNERVAQGNKHRPQVEIDKCSGQSFHAKFLLSNDLRLWAARLSRPGRSAD